MPRTWAMVAATSSGSRIGARSTKNTPPRKLSSKLAATWRARRGVPGPPGAVEVGGGGGRVSPGGGGPRPPPQQFVNRVQLPLPPDQGRERGGEVVGSHFQRLERGEVARQVGGSELEDSLRPHLALEAVLAEI